MALFFSDHKLVDFDDWFATFKNNKVRLELEDKTGVKAIRVMRFPDNKNHCMVVFEAPNRAAMSLIETDPRLHERFKDKSIFNHKSIKQDYVNEIRYTKKNDFYDRVLNQYFKKKKNFKMIKKNLKKKFSKKLFINPYLI